MEKRKLIRELQSHQSALKEKAREKARESISAVIPIVLIVFILGFTVAALSPGILVEFLVGSVLVILGMIFFSMGAELSMTPMGEHVGGSMLRTKKLGFIIIIGFILGFIITISEPDLQVLAEQVSSVPNLVLILSVAVSYTHLDVYKRQFRQSVFSNLAKRITSGSTAQVHAVHVPRFTMTVEKNMAAASRDVQ